MNLSSQRIVRVGWTAVMLAIMIGASAEQAVGRNREVEVRWGELAGAVGNRDVALTLPDGAIVEGTVVEVQNEALKLQIKKTTDSRYRRSPLVTIPRASVKILQTREIRGPWRAIGAAAFAGGGAVAGWAIAEGVFHVSGEGSGIWSEPKGPALVLGLAGGGGLAGYLIGRKSDRQITYLKIVP